MPEEKPDEYLTVQEAAEYLNVTETAVRGAILDDRLPSTVKYGRKVISRNDLAAYKARTQPDGTAKAGRPVGSKKRAQETA